MGQEFQFIDSEDLLIEASFDGGGTGLEITGPTSYAESGGDATTRQITTLRGNRQRSGKPGVPTVVIECIPAPHMRVFRMLKKFANDGKAAQFRVSSKSSEAILAVSSGDETAAVAKDTGAVTFAGDNPSLDNVAPGDILSIGNVKFIIDSFTDATDMVVTKTDGVLPDAATVAGAYKVDSPRIQRPWYPARITNPPDLLSAAVDSEVSLTLNLAPTGNLPDVVIL